MSRFRDADNVYNPAVERRIGRIDKGGHRSATVLLATTAISERKRPRILLTDATAAGDQTSRWTAAEARALAALLRAAADLSDEIDARAPSLAPEAPQAPAAAVVHAPSGNKRAQP